MRTLVALRRHPQAVDSLLAAAVALFTLLESTQPDRAYRHPAVMVPAALLTTSALALRRRHPLGVLAWVTAVSTAAALLVTTPASAGMFVTILIATYTLVVRCPRRVVAWTLPYLFVGALITSLRDPATHGVVEALPTFGILAAVVMVGEVVRRSRERAERLRRLTAELAESRSQAEQLAVSAERLRIAREMHDVLAHGVSVMTLQVGAARMALHDSAPQVAGILQEVEGLGREALEELRDILGLLRDGTSTDDVDQPAGPADLGRLLTTMRSAGLPLTVGGLDLLDSLTPAVRAAVHRIVQEALTNTLKHAGTPRTTLTLQQVDGRLTVEVTDSGLPRPRPQVPGGGHGLGGLRERVAALGGRISAGPAATGTGWTVQAEFPLVDHDLSTADA